jgi:hypothetical protein
MKFKAVVLAVALSLSLSATASASTEFSTAEAIAKYNKYINADSYVKDELYNVADFRANYASMKGTLAYQIVERAIWYMENGYWIYGHGTESYGPLGYEDCSGFTRLVFGDFGMSVTGTSANYNTVGTKVEGVGKELVNGKWKITGVENLRIGDVFTFQETDHIMHVAIYMGTNRDGQPVVIGTRGDGNPTALGTVDGWQYWWGENFQGARRVVPEAGFTSMAGKIEKSPVIPKQYVLPPQAPIVMPEEPVVTPPVTPPVVTPPVVTPPPSTKQYVVTKKGWVTLHKSALLASADVGRLQLGEKAELIKKVNDYWYQVKVNGKIVYITTSSTYTKIV